MLDKNINLKIEAAIGGRIDCIHKIGSGVNNAVYLIEIKGLNYALKIKERGIYDFFENESSALKEMDGFIAPKLYLYDYSDLDNKFMLIEYIDGEPIKSVNEIGITKLAELVNEIHEKTKRKNSATKNLKSDLKNYLDDKCYFNVHELEKIPFSKTQELIETCDKAINFAENYKYSDPENEVLIHGDLNVTNIIKDKSGKWRLIDWELSRYTQIETEIAALIWAHCKNEQDIAELLNSELCGNGKTTIALMTLARGLDVSTWRTKWINSLCEKEEKMDLYHSELEEDWSKIRILKTYLSD